MWGLTFIGVLFSVVSSQDLIGVNYSFDVDFYKIFNNKSCDAHDNWNLIEYADMRMTSPDNSLKGIRSKRESCTTSFSIVFFDSSVLELNIFFDVTAEESGLEINIFDENGTSEVTYWYSKSSSNYKPGWSTLSIAIHTNATGYINLIGHSQNHETVIVDSFRYITRSTINKDTYDITKTDKSYEPDDLLENVDDEFDLLFNEGSGEGSGEEFDLRLGQDFDEEDDLDEKGVTKIEE